MEDRIIEQLNKFKPEPSKEWQDRTLNRLKYFSENETETKNPRKGFSNFISFIIFRMKNKNVKVLIASALVFLLVAGSGGAVMASNSSVPGDLLYPLDLSLEQFQRNLITDPIQKSEYELQILEERMQELYEVSKLENIDNINAGTAELSAQQLRIQEQLGIMNQLRVENKIQTQEQLEIMEKLQNQINEGNGMMQNIENNLENKGNGDSIQNLNQQNNEFNNNVNLELNKFENETGVSIQENQQNSGTETQIQNQNQTNTQDQGTSNTNTPSGGSGSNDDTQQQGGQR
jgi:hypothetical protein